MNKETLRMQMLAGVITETQYKTRLNESIDIIPMMSDFIKQLVERDKPQIFNGESNTSYTSNFKLNPKGDIYDFGGADNPIRYGKNMVVDMSDEIGDEEDVEEWVDENGVEGIIDGDLEEFIKLPPRDGINMTDAYIYFEDPSTVSKTINSSLKSGGILVIKDSMGSINDLLKKLSSYKLLELNIIDADEELESDDWNIGVVLKK